MARGSVSESVVRRHLDTLRRALPEAADGDAEAVHRARIATRRLREVLSVFGTTGKTAKALRRGVRRLTRVLGQVRDLDVAVHNLVALEPDTRVPRSALIQLRQSIADERRSAEKRARKSLKRCRLGKMRKRALRIARRAQESSDRTGARLLAAAWRHAAGRARTLRVTSVEAGDGYVPDRLHMVRVAVKKLRYALEAASELSGTRPVAGVAKLKESQDLLGRMHDFDALIVRLRALQAEEIPRRRSRELDRLARRLEDRCRDLHQRYLGTRSALRLVCDRTERTAQNRAGAAA